MSTTPSPEAILAYYKRAMEGHVYIQETVDALVDTVCARLSRMSGRPRVLEIGSHAGTISVPLTRRAPSVDLIIAEQNPTLIELSRRRLEARPVQYHQGPLASVTPAVDLVLSIARHHHLPHDYLAGVRAALAPDGYYVLGDEFCPEYCDGEHARRIREASVLTIAGGYVLTSPSEVARYEKDGTVPEHARELERLRLTALWRWYRHVVDVAVERGYFDIAQSELQSTADDFVTGSAAEHKYSPLIVERQLELAGFERVSCRSIGPDDAPELQSMFVYEFRPAR